MIWQLELLVSAVDLFHERLEVNSAGSTVPISRPVFQNYMRRAHDEHRDVTAEASDTDQFRLRLVADSESRTTDLAIATHFCDATWAPGVWHWRLH